MPQAGYDNPSAARIAEILRCQDPWPMSSNPVDLAQRVVSQHRHMLDIGGGRSSGTGTTVMTCPEPAIAPLSFLSSATDVKMGQLAERISVLVAGLQQRGDVEKQELQRQLDQVGAQMDERVRCMEARIKVCEEQNRLQIHPEPFGMIQNSAGTALALREARALVGSALSEAEGQWQLRHGELRAELRGEQQQQLQHLEELADQVRNQAGQLEQAERAFGGYDRALHRFEEELQGLLARDEDTPPWFAQLEGALAGLERRLNEQQVTIEVQLGRLRVEVDSVRRRSEGFQSLREEVLHEAEERLQQEVERLEMEVQHVAKRGLGQFGPDGQQHGGSRDSAKRLDDTEARVAALRVRVDAHDSRFGSIGERSEAACQQAVESARQVCLQQRDEILSETDCQLRILRQRVETLSELCEELMLRQTTNGSQRGMVPPSRHWEHVPPPSRGGSM